MSRMVLGCWYNNPDGLDIRVEYGKIKSHSDNATEFDEIGTYALIGYHFDEFLPIIRWDMYKDNIIKSSNRNYKRILVGASYSPVKKIKLQFNYGYTMYDEDFSNITGIGNASQIQLMTIFKF